MATRLAGMAQRTGFPNNGKAFQRVIRESLVGQPDPLLEEKKALASDFTNASVREITFKQARDVILQFVWLGNMGTTQFAFGLFFGSHLAGVVCYGSTAGTHVRASVCGEEHKHEVITLVRGTCAHWAHPHSASFLISAACKQMTEKGYHAFVSYSDVEAGEVGTVYQSTGWTYCGKTQPSEKYITIDGRVHDSRQIHGLTRDRTGGNLRYTRTRAEQRQILIEEGCQFFMGEAKHRYVGIYGDRRMKCVLRKALQWKTFPYPKRPVVAAAVGQSLTLIPTTEPDTRPVQSSVSLHLEDATLANENAPRDEK